MRIFFTFIALLTFLPAGFASDAETARAYGAATLVIYSKNDPLSSTLAKFYALGRKVPDDQVIGLEVSAQEEITRAEFEKTLQRPLRDLFNRKGWWRMGQQPNVGRVPVENRIRFIAIMRGVPLKIVSPAELEMRAYQARQRATPSPYAQPGASPSPKPPPPPQPAPLQREEASVDSELAALGILSNPYTGPLMNPYFRSFRPILEANLPFIMLVGRMDGPDAEVVHRMITESLEVEKSGLAGAAYIDRRSIRSDGYKQGDDWLTDAANSARNFGLPVIHDARPGTLPADYPMRDAALYLGWYTTHADGPFVSEDFRFRRGAVAVHIHSFSAQTLRTQSLHWAGPLLNKGAIATLGNVYEPYLDLTPHLDIFANRLLNGFTLAESAFMASKSLSWMTTVLGDPLYRPFASWTRTSSKPSEAVDDMADWRAYRTARLQNLEDRPGLEAAVAAHAKKTNNPLFLESLAHDADADGRIDDAIRWLREALELTGERADQIRIHFHLAAFIEKKDGKPAALKYVQGQIERLGSATPFHTLEAELTPPPPPPAQP